MSEDHHPYSPSSLARRYVCPGSERMERGLPDRPSPDAEEGTETHKEIAEAIWKRWKEILIARAKSL